MKIALDVEPYFLRDCHLRDDIAALVKYGNNRNIWLNLTDKFPHPYKQKNAEQWLEYVAATNEERVYAIATPDEAIGTISIHYKHGVDRLGGELGYWLGEPFWGQGIATSAVKRTVKVTFETTDLIRIYAHFYHSNPASGRVLEKAGFQLEGRLKNAVIKDGKILDVLVYAVLK
jgi:RimJ/RimL family protein N-acetyltransferase